MISENTDNQQKQIKVTRYNNQQQAFFKSDAALTAKTELKHMVSNPKYNTREIFSAMQAGNMPFVERHMKYLSEHPKLNPRHYLANLKLMTKIKR